MTLMPKRIMSHGSMVTQSVPQPTLIPASANVKTPQTPLRCRGAGASDAREHRLAEDGIYPGWPFTVSST